MASKSACSEKRTGTALAISLMLSAAPWLTAAAQLPSPSQKQQEEQAEEERMRGQYQTERQNLDRVQNALKGSNVSSMQRALDEQNAELMKNAQQAHPLRMKPVTDTDSPTGLPSTPPLRGVTPGTPIPKANQLSMPSLKKENYLALDELQDITEESTTNSGAIFVRPDEIRVQAPLLKAMINLDQKMSPYDLDAMSATPVSLHDVLQTNVMRNLPIKISNQEAYTSLWQLRQSYAGFLPNFSEEFSYEGIKGTYVTPVGAAVPISNPYLSSTAQLQWYVFKGGAIIHTMLEDKQNYRASKAALKTSINDTLLEAAKNYYNLVLNDALLQIRIKAVEVARGVVVVNQDQYDFGTIPQVDVLQAKYQLSNDRQQLIKQQIARRTAAVTLATGLNLDQGVDLTLKDRLVRKIRLVDEKMTPADLLRVAIDNRPELKRYEDLRLAAKEAVKVARAALFPTVAAVGSIVGTGSRVYNNNQNINNGTPLGAGDGIGSIYSSDDLPINGTTGRTKMWTGRSLGIIGVDVNWQLGGLGWQQITGVKIAKSQARKAQLDFANELNLIYGDVRDTYLSSITAENLIVETTDAVRYSQEALRIAEVRFIEGVGTYVDVLIAQRNYIEALTNKAHAIIDFNVAQATLLHAIGRNTVDTLTSNVPLKE